MKVRPDVEALAASGLLKAAVGGTVTERVRQFIVAEMSAGQQGNGHRTVMSS